MNGFANQQRPGVRGTPALVLKGFKFDQSYLLTDHKKNLDALALRISQTQGTNFPVEGILVIGHTDSTGTDLYNHCLGMKRAISAMCYLMERLAKRHGRKLQSGLRIQYDSFGEATPVSQSASDNRRVEIFLGISNKTRPTQPPPPPTYIAQKETFLDEILDEEGEWEWAGEEEWEY